MKAYTFNIFIDITEAQVCSAQRQCNAEIFSSGHQSACSANDIIQEVACCEDSFNVVMSHLVINYAVEDTLH